MADIDPAIMADSNSESEEQVKGENDLQHEYVAWIFMNSFAGDGWKPKELGSFKNIPDFWNIY